MNSLCPRLCVLGLLWPVVAAGADNFLPRESKLTGTEVHIPMRDGKQLAGDVYLPKTATGKFPTILIQTPYDKNAMRGGFNGAGRGHPLYQLQDCAIVTTDWRGRAGSADALTQQSMPGGSDDGFDTIEWIVAQGWCNGKVGTWGGSALGRVQYTTARARHRNHVCAAPSIMPLNLDYDIYFPGGALWEEYVVALGRIGFERRGWLVANPLNGHYWRELERTEFVKPSDINIPMLVYGGWFDTYTDGVIDCYLAIKAGGGEKARAETRLLMGPWTHGHEQPQQGDLTFTNASGVGGRRSVEFFNHQLRGESNDEAGRAPVTYYQMGANEWRTSDRWPPAGRAVEYHLTDSKSLSVSPPDKAASFAYKSDPANPVPKVGGRLTDPTIGRGPRDQREKVESRTDVLTFSSGVLEQDLAIAGPLHVALHVSTDGPDTDFVAILTDVHPDGRSIAITEGIQRLRFREGSKQERMAEPSKVYPIEIKVQSTAITVRKGHQARLIIASSAQPYWAVNANDGGPMYDGHAGRVAINTIYVGPGHDSKLILPVVEK